MVARWLYVILVPRYELNPSLLNVNVSGGFHFSDFAFSVMKFSLYFQTFYKSVMWLKDKPNSRQQITQTGIINDKNRKQNP